MEVLIIIGIIIASIYYFSKSTNSNARIDIISSSAETVRPVSHPEIQPKPEPPPDLDQSDSDWQRCLDLLHNDTNHLFITGKAGTGKSTLIRTYRQETKKSVVTVAFTGLAALNVGGQTINSFFRLPWRFLDKKAVKSVLNKALYRNIDEIIIDEISMVRADMLDAIDYFLRINGRDKDLPFGGCRIIFVGDMFQLPPIAEINVKPLFQKHYDLPQDQEPYMFIAKAFKTIQPTYIELKKPYRQDEPVFFEILDKIRFGNVSDEEIQPINDKLSIDAGPTINNKVTALTTTRGRARYINESLLQKIQSEQREYKAQYTGDFLKLKRKASSDNEDNLPAEDVLYLKKGSRVIFTKNDAGNSKRWVNGTCGIVMDLSNDFISVKIDETEKVFNVEMATWEKIKYKINKETGELDTEVTGTMRQFPLRLAWALTIHKSQGLSFAKLHVDFTSEPFAHGQTYVALSRCRKIAGLSLQRKIQRENIIVDSNVAEFYRKSIEGKQ